MYKCIKYYEGKKDLEDNGLGATHEQRSVICAVLPCIYTHFKVFKYVVFHNKVFNFIQLFIPQVSLWLFLMSLFYFLSFLSFMAKLPYGQLVTQRKCLQQRYLRGKY